jgi:hypothetical protein
MATYFSSLEKCLEKFSSIASMLCLYVQFQICKMKPGIVYLYMALVVAKESSCSRLVHPSQLNTIVEYFAAGRSFFSSVFK